MKKLLLFATLLAVLAGCKKEEPAPTPTPTDVVKDICGNQYKFVTIGAQTWMAENLKCNKYDTESEAHNAAWLTDNTITLKTSSTTNDACYNDATDKTQWFSQQTYATNVTDTHIAKFGYAYSWAAAVGLEKYNKQSIEFEGNRQGICPNGWHLPKVAEFKALKEFIEKTDGKGENSAGKHLKSTSGWYDDGKPTQYPQGLDTYGFAALPAGYAETTVQYVGRFADFWSASPAEKSGDGKAVFYQFSYDLNTFQDSEYFKTREYSVRCVKN